MSTAEIIERIKLRVAAVDPNGPRTILGVFQLNVISPKGNQKWTIDLKALTVTKGTVQFPDVISTISEDDFILVGTKEISAVDAISSRKVNVEGDKILAAALLSRLIQ